MLILVFDLIDLSLYLNLIKMCQNYINANNIFKLQILSFFNV